MIGGVALSVHPMTAGTKLVSRIANERLSTLENYFAQRAGSLQTVLEESKMLLPTWIEDEWCEVTQKDHSTISSDRPALPPPPHVDKENLKSLPLVLPKVKFEVISAQKPDFDPEGWLLV